MAKFRKNLIVSENNYSGTGILSKLNLSGKFYLGLFLLVIGLLIQSFLILSCFYEYRNELMNIANFRKLNDDSIIVFRDLSQDILEKFKISSSARISVDVTGDLTQIIQASDKLKENLEDNIGLKQIDNIQALTGEFEQVSSPLSSEIYQGAVKLFAQFQEAVNELETVLSEYYQLKYHEVGIIIVIKFAVVLLILLLEITVSKWLVRCALRSVEEPADRIIRSLQGVNIDLQVKLPIYASEGLGATGLILNDAIVKWHTLAMEFKNASNKLGYLVDELASGFNQVFFLEVQLCEVYREIESSLENQQQISNSVNKEIEMLSSDLPGLQNLPRKISEVADEFNSFLTVNQEYLKGVIDRKIEVNNRSHEVIIFLRELGATSGRIDQIMKELAEIEEESEMLAFNSAISAARAGEEGKGFSVVAKEIANLVDRSKKASNNLSELIGEIQTQTDQIVSLMPENDEVESGRIALDHILNTICQNLNETATICLTEFIQMRQVVDTMIGKSSETFEAIKSGLNLPQVETSGLNQIKTIVDRYLESIRHTREIKDEIFDTVNSLQTATDLLLSRNA